MWTWVFRAACFVFFAIEFERSSAVLFKYLGPTFPGVICCDYHSAYKKFLRLLIKAGTGIRAQFCLAHLKRDLKFIAQHLFNPELVEYGERNLALLKEIFALNRLLRRLKSPRRRGDPDDPDLNLTGEARERRAREVLEKLRGLGQQFKASILDCPDHRLAKNMAKRFQDWPLDFYLTFMTDEGIRLEVPPTNNPAEQSLRSSVIDSHVTFGSRSESGRDRSEIAWTVIGTCAMQNRSAFDFIKDSIIADKSGKKPPSLLP
jgi:hypothetical protein